MMTDSEMLDWLHIFGSRFIHCTDEGFRLEYYDKNDDIHSVDGLDLRDCIRSAILKQKGIE